jgi:hypothetical protein
MAGKTLGAHSGTCITTNSAAGRSGGKSLASPRRASTPPEEAPITIVSCRLMNVLCGSSRGLRCLAYTHRRRLVCKA